jgi:hypothetical protein
MNHLHAATIAVCLALLPAAAIAADQTRSPAPDGAAVYIISPGDGERVPSTFTVRFGLRGMGVAPAGSDVAGTGHHHLLIDAPAGLDLSKPLPANQQVRHFGGGQTETRLTLPPGRHRLQLLLANHQHVPHDPPVMSGEIAVEVLE